AFGIVGICAQLGVPFVTRTFKSKSLILMWSTVFCFATMFVTGFAQGFLVFGICLTIYGLFNGLRNPMINAIIAENNSKAEQGKVMGINQSYVSLGQILGPVTAGYVGACSVHSIF